MVQEMNAIHGTHTLYAANVSGDGTDVLTVLILLKRLVLRLSWWRQVL